MTEQTANISPARVPVERIDDLMGSLKVTCLRFPGTTTTAAIAVLPGVGNLPGFTVAEGLAFCHDPMDFDARRGVKIATDNAMKEARAALWKMEAYCAWRQIQDQALDAGLCYSVSAMLPPHQQCVVDEKADLDERRIALESLIGTSGVPGSPFDALPVNERVRLKAQCRIMGEYSDILAQRIADFQPVKGRHG
jgi:hypothetical protein